MKQQWEKGHERPPRTAVRAAESPPGVTRANMIDTETRQGHARSVGQFPDHRALGYFSLLQSRYATSLIQFEVPLNS